MTEPTAAETGEFWLRLHLFIEGGLKRAAALHGVETALAMARQFDDGEWRLMTEVNFDADKQPIPGSLKYRVDIYVPSIDEFMEFLAVKSLGTGCASGA
jgi:hypothetical protein